MDEECKFPNSTDKTLLEKLHTNFAKHKHYTQPRKSGTSFVIIHYAGEVSYEISSFLEKNRDTIYDDIIELGRASLNPLISKLFEEDTSTGKKTVGAQFKDQVNALMQTLSATSPHYIRCIKPNTMKESNNFDDQLVLLQLRFSGMLDTVRIRKSGYPIRFDLQEFYERFKIFSPSTPANDLRKVSHILLSQLPINQETWKIGLTKVFWE